MFAKLKLQCLYVSHYLAKQHNTAIATTRSCSRRTHTNTPSTLPGNARRSNTHMNVDSSSSVLHFRNTEITLFQDHTRAESSRPPRQYSRPNEANPCHPHVHGGDQ